VGADNNHHADVLYKLACQRVLRYTQLAKFCQGTHIHASHDYGTHWLFTVAVPVITDHSRIFMYVEIVAEKGTGDIYSFPSRRQHPIDTANIASIRQGCARITPQALDQME
jgi:hypothetical protein